MTIEDNFRDEKLQYVTNKEDVKLSTLSLGKLINMNIIQVKKDYLLLTAK